MTIDHIVNDIKTSAITAPASYPKMMTSHDETPSSSSFDNRNCQVTRVESLVDYEIKLSSRRISPVDNSLKLIIHGTSPTDYKIMSSINGIPPISYKDKPLSSEYSLADIEKVKHAIVDKSSCSSDIRKKDQISLWIKTMSVFSFVYGTVS